MCNPQGTLSQYANLQALWTLPQATVSATAATTHQATTVTMTYTSTAPTASFFPRADVRRATASGHELPGDNELQSSIWNGNDITLWPGESQTLTVSYSSADLQGTTPVISVSGWNVPKPDIVAPVP